MKRVYVLLLGIIFVGVFLRFFQLATNPPALTWDEAAWGYNAYALLTTGRDEFGRFMPIDYLESFGDFKPPLYAYLTVLPVWMFGLTEFATRLPSAFFGTMMIVLTFFLTRIVFYDAKHRNAYGLLAAFFLAVSPWHINLSRAAFEANVASFFLMLGGFLFLYGMRTRPILIVFSFVSFVLSMYTFNTARIVAPLLIIVLLFVGFRAKQKKVSASVLVGLVLGGLFLLPAIPFLSSEQASLRFREVNIFTDVSIVERANQQIENNDNELWAKVLSNRRVFYTLEYAKHYLDNLNPLFLFTKGDGNPKFSTQQVGQMYLWDVPFYILGILFLFRRREGFWYILPIWFLIGIIPAGTARETPHALRIATVLPIPQMLVAYGFVQLWQILQVRVKRYAFVITGLAVLFLCVNVFYYLHFYYAHYPRIYSGEWQYGYKDAMLYAKEHEKEYKTIYVTRELGRPYIYQIFYQQMPPQEFQEKAAIQREVFGFVNVQRVGNYIFYEDFPTGGEQLREALLISTPDEVPENATILKYFPLLNGEGSLVAYTI